MNICRTTLHFLLLLLITIVPASAAAELDEQHRQSEEVQVERQPITIPVSFVTVRNKTGSTGLSDYFGGNRGQMSAGIASVEFSPIWGLEEIADSAPFYIPDTKIDLVDIREIPLETLFKETKRFSNQDGGNLVLYVHGYNIDFEKSCRRSGIFQKSLGLQDRLLLFSWPADGNMLKYTWDEADLVWSVPHIAQFLENLVSKTGNSRVDIVAHSLGARGVMQALVRLAYRERSSTMLNELVLMAPDIDTDSFRQELPILQSVTKRISIYVSDNDKALRLSQEVHGYPRLGQAGENLSVFDGVETIDISGINTRRISGHLYHLFSPEVIKDLTELLHTGKPAAERASLSAGVTDGLPYWQMIIK